MRVGFSAGDKPKMLPINPPVFVMAVTSRPPSRRISNLRFFIFGKIEVDVVAVAGAVIDVVYGR